MVAETGDPAVGRGGPLDGVRVLDLSRVLAGPWCAQSLADLGAEVLKVESPGAGDDTRTWGPPHFGDIAAYYACANRSKASLVVDLKDPEGQKLVRALAAEADILIENFKLGTLERMGLGYDVLAADNPRLIYCAISGYGRTGADAPRAGYDFVIQAETGLMSITGEPDGEPLKVGVAVSDLLAGMYASQAVLAALVEQRRTGRGQAIDVALFDCQLAALANVQSNTLASGTTPKRYGNAHANVVPYEAFEAADGTLVVALGNDRQYRSLCRDVLHDEVLLDDPKFQSNSGRLANRVEVSARLNAHFREQTRAHWLEKFHALGLPGGIVRTVDEALDCDQVRERGLIHSFGDGPDDIRVVGYPVRMSRPLPAPFSPRAVGEGGAAVADRWLGTMDHGAGA